MDSSFSMDKARIHCQTREKVFTFRYDWFKISLLYITN